MKLIYFLRRADGSGPIKIGCSVYPLARAKQIGIDMKARMQLLAEASGSLEIERELHARFAPHRRTLSDLPERKYPIGGKTEWFEPVPELLDLIAVVKVCGAIPALRHDFSPYSRNDAIARRWLAGETLQSIGSSFGLTRERIRQIVAGMNLRREWRKAA